jgi:rhomboid protease GluP
MQARRRFPTLTALTLMLTAAVTATRFAGTGVVHALWRDPSGLEHGQSWRLLTPVLVQTDPGWTVVKVMILCAFAGAAAERVFSRGQWIFLYLVGALAGHSIGEVFQPHQGGTSVAFAGLLGGLAAVALLRGDEVNLVLRIEAAVCIPLAILDTVIGDIHGLPFLAGLSLASIWLIRDGARFRVRVRVRARGPARSVRSRPKPGYHRTATSYADIARSAVPSAVPRSRAWATRSRSNGSR